MTFSPLLFAQEEGNTTSSAIGWAIFVILVVVFLIGVVLNMRRGRREVGAELELAANRKPYLSDEELEGPKLDRTLGLGLLFLGVIAVTLPLYWLGEPSRQEEAVADFQSQFISRGERLYNEGAQCANCHGPAGVGGAAAAPLLNERGEFVEMVNWQAPALDTVLFRYSREEVFEILQYGRPQSPMAAWGTEGGGPLTEQQVWNIIYYLESIQLPAAEAAQNVEDELARTCAPDATGRCTITDYGFETLGQAMFDMGYQTGFAGGAYSCGRCHTRGWSIGRAELSGGGALGPNLTGGSVLRQFPTVQSQIDFISQGAERGRPYGTYGQAGDGTMPGYGVNPNASEEGSPMSPDQVMYTQDQIAAVVQYERGL